MWKNLPGMLFALAAFPAMAQERDAISRSGKSALKTTASFPIIISCASLDQPRAACFRLSVTVRVRASGTPTKIGWLTANHWWAMRAMRESSAFLTGGATCDVRMGTELRQANLSYNNYNINNENITLSATAPTVTSETAYRFPLTFNCDQEVNASDLVTVQFTLVESTGGVDRDGNVPGRLVQFILDDMPFASATQVFRPPTTPTPSGSPTAPGFGFRITTVPDGAYIREVIPGSSAERAGLVPGMVISSLDGAPLGGLDATQIAQAFNHAGSEASITIIGRGVVTLKRAQIDRR